MLRTKISGRKIKLVDKPNAHRLAIGKSGYGKTWCSYRMIEDAVRTGKYILILDYSGSYTIQEFSEGKFAYVDQMEILRGESMKWIYAGKDFYGAFQDAMIKALHLRGYRQKVLMRKIVQGFAAQRMDITILSMIKALEMELNDSDNAEKNIVETVLNRVSAYADVDTIFTGKANAGKNLVKPVTVIQLSELETMKKIFLTELFSELFWKNVKEKKNWGGYIVYDEFQNISLETGSTLSEMLREGRKYGLGVWLASQFLSDCSADEKDMLLQASNILLFRPTERDVKSVAMLLDCVHWKQKIGSLEKLDVGEVILKGNFLVDQNPKVMERSVLCKVEG